MNRYRYHKHLHNIPNFAHFQYQSPRHSSIHNPYNYKYYFLLSQDDIPLKAQSFVISILHHT